MEADPADPSAARDDTEQQEQADAQQPVAEQLEPHDVIEDYFTEREDVVAAFSPRPSTDDARTLISSPEEPDAPEQLQQTNAERILTQNGFAYEEDVSCWSRNTSIWIMEEAMVCMAMLLCCVVLALLAQWCLYYR